MGTGTLCVESPRPHGKPPSPYHTVVQFYHTSVQMVLDNSDKNLSIFLVHFTVLWLDQGIHGKNVFGMVS